MNTNVDLNIDNYNYTDLLNLFQLKSDFTSEHLKQCYKTIIQLHPDKSGLDSKYFLFFSKAFIMLKSVYAYLYKQKQETSYNGCSWKTDYENQHNRILHSMEKENPNKDLKQIIETMNPKQFNMKFNKIFEEVKSQYKEEEKGYGEWIQSNDDYVVDTNIKVNTIQDMNEQIQKSKYKIKDQIVKKNEYSTINNQQTTLHSIIPSRQNYYGSDPFSKNKYEDLKHAYKETVIPVTEEDFHNRKKYNTIQHLEHSRKEQSNNALQYYDTHRQIVKDNEEKEQRKNLDLAYELLKNEEKYKKANTMFVSKFRSITNY